MPTITDTRSAKPCANSGVSTAGETFSVGVGVASAPPDALLVNCATPAAPSPEPGREVSPVPPCECLSDGPTLASAETVCALATAAGVATGTEMTGTAVVVDPTAPEAASAVGVGESSDVDDELAPPEAAAMLEEAAASMPFAAAFMAAAAAVWAVAAEYVGVPVLSAALVAPPSAGLDVAASMTAVVAAAPLGLLPAPVASVLFAAGGLLATEAEADAEAGGLGGTAGAEAAEGVEGAEPVEATEAVPELPPDPASSSFESVSGVPATRALPDPGTAAGVSAAVAAAGTALAGSGSKPPASGPAVCMLDTGAEAIGAVFAAEPFAAAGGAADEAAAAATGAAAGAAGGGELLPDAGNWPPLVALSLSLSAAALRAGLGGGSGAALFISAAKSLPLGLGAAGLAEAAPPACAAPLVCEAALFTGAREITGMAFMPYETASDVPSDCSVARWCTSAQRARSGGMH